MSPHAYLTVTTIVAMFLGLARTRAPPHVVVLSALGLLLGLGAVSPAGALSGFSNPGVITVGALFVVAAGLRRTGVLAHLVQAGLGRPRSIRAAQARLVFPVAVASAFLNNTPVVAMLLPVVTEWARRVSIPASQLLLPLSYGAILGGMCTVLGTSTNLVLDGLLRETGHPGLGLFDLAWVGGPAALAGIAFLLLAARRLLPDQEGGDEAFGDPREYTTELRVAPGGAVAGRSIRQAGLRNLPGAYLAEVHRGAHVVTAVRPDQVLEEGDHLVFVGAVESVVEIQRLPGLVQATRQVFRLTAPAAERTFAEAVVSASSPLAGLSVKEARFRNRYDAVVLGVSREGTRVSGKIGDIVLQPGDALLLEATPSFLDRHAGTRDFYLVSLVEGEGPATREKARIALAILAGMLLLVGAGVLSMLQASLLAAIATLATRTCSEETAYQALDFRLLLTIAGALGLARALTETKAAQALAEVLLGLGDASPHTTLVLVYVATALLSECVTNNAAAAIMFPIALSASQDLGVSPLPFVVTLMIAASASFASPLGYQTNLMVYGAGHYRVGDFVRIGVPMSLVVGAVVVFLAPVVWPF